MRRVTSAVALAVVVAVASCVAVYYSVLYSAETDAKDEFRENFSSDLAEVRPGFLSVTDTPHLRTWVVPPVNAAHPPRPHLAVTLSPVQLSIFPQ